MEKVEIQTPPRNPCDKEFSPKHHLWSWPWVWTLCKRSFPKDRQGLTATNLRKSFITIGHLFWQLL